MDQVISFDKSLQTRLQEYELVFSDLESVPFSKIRSEWSYYLELTLDPNGWQAVWKIPRIKCEEFQISFPTVVLVYVMNVKYNDLAALVRILAVKDDIHLPEKHYVPLMQLWATKEQDHSIATSLNLNSTANALDMVRFFFIHLLMPWDEEEDSTDWIRNHLVSRLRFYYDLKNGKIPKATTEHIYALLNEARRLSSKKQMLTNLCEEESDCDVEQDGGFVNQNVEALMEINVRLLEIENEINLLENETYRRVILKRQELTEVGTNNTQRKSHIWLICENAQPCEYMRFLKSVDELYPNENVTFANNLMSKLESANMHDTILLSPNEHKIKTEGALIESIILKGIGDKANCQILSQADVILDCIGDSPVIENITFDCKNAHCAVLIRSGNVTIKNCKFVGDASSSTRQGFLILKEAKLTLVDCEITGFAVAVTGNSGSTIVLKNTSIEGATIGIKVHDDCNVNLSKSALKNCKNYGIVLETEKDYSINEFTGSFEELRKVPHITVDQIIGINNQMADVVFNKTQIQAMGNLFSNPDLDPTILGSSDEEMETSCEINLNNTVVEVLDTERST